MSFSIEVKNLLRFGCCSVLVINFPGGFKAQHPLLEDGLLERLLSEYGLLEEVKAV